MDYYGQDDYHDYDPDFDRDPDDWDDDPCEHCGPWCDEWGGDNLCMAQIRYQSKQSEYYLEHHTRDSKCPVCGKELKEYDAYSRNGELWEWNEEFFDAMIAIMHVYHIYDVPKGEIHHEGNVYHIWIGSGENREEKLIRVIKEIPEELKEWRQKLITGELEEETTEDE